MSRWLILQRLCIWSRNCELWRRLLLPCWLILIKPYCILMPNGLVLPIRQRDTNCLSYWNILTKWWSIIDNCMSGMPSRKDLYLYRFDWIRCCELHSRILLSIRCFDFNSISNLMWYWLLMPRRFYLLAFVLAWNLLTINWTIFLHPLPFGIL